MVLELPETAVETVKRSREDDCEKGTGNYKKAKAGVEQVCMVIKIFNFGL